MQLRIEPLLYGYNEETSGRVFRECVRVGKGRGVSENLGAQEDPLLCTTWP